jgi:16S rRNA (guanine527-N7)-methyltransferase
MNPSRITELLDPFLDRANGQRLTTNDLSSISTYIDILQHWNARVNLTAIRNEEEIVTRHFGESLFTARYLFPRDKHLGTADPKRSEAEITVAEGDREGHGFSRANSTPQKSAALTTEGHSRRFSPRSSASSALNGFEVADLGSGAGFPGIPIKLWAPEIKLTLIESNHKKATFLREVVRALTLTDVDIQNTRAESLRNVSFNVVTLRAVERFDSILPVASNLISPEGRLALLIGQSQLPRAQSILPTLLPTLTWPAIVPIPHSESRVLAIATPT